MLCAFGSSKLINAPSVEEVPLCKKLLDETR